jgi:hypothetical protein
MDQTKGMNMRQSGLSLQATLPHQSGLELAEATDTVLDMTSESVVIALSDGVLEVDDDVKGMYFIGELGRLDDLTTDVCWQRPGKPKEGPGRHQDLETTRSGRNGDFVVDHSNFIDHDGELTFRPQHGHGAALITGQRTHLSKWSHRHLTFTSHSRKRLEVERAARRNNRKCRAIFAYGHQGLEHLIKRKTELTGYRLGRKALLCEVIGKGSVLNLSLVQ